MAMSKKTKLILLTFLIILLGFLRDYLFDNINWVYMTLMNGRANQARDEFHFLLNWTLREINTLKWILTFLFTGLFLVMTLWIIHVAFKNKIFNRITIASFAGLMAISAILFFVGYIFGQSDNLYGVIRTLMGFAQSFMPLMVLYVLFKFLPEQNKIDF